MLVYLSVFIVIASVYIFENLIVFHCDFSTLQKRKIRSAGIFLCLFFLFLFTAFRHEVGWDYAVYYDTVINDVDTSIVLRGEFLTVFLVEVGRYFDSSFLYFAINSFIFYLFFYLGMRRFNLLSYVALLFFISFPLFFLNSLSVVRTFTAIGIVFYAVSFLSERRLLTYFFLIIVSSFFHSSALYALLFPLFCYYKVGVIFYVILFVVALSSRNLLESFMLSVNPVLVNYLKPTEIQEGTKAIYLFGSIALFLFFFKRKFINSDVFYSSHVTNILFNIYMFGFFTYALFLDYGTLGHRLSLYGTFFSVVLVPKMILLLRPVAIPVVGSYVFCCLLFFLLFLSVYIAQESLIPYKFIFN